MIILIVNINDVLALFNCPDQCWHNDWRTRDSEAAKHHMELKRCDHSWCVMVHQFVLKYLTGHALITAGTTTGAPEIREQEKLGRKTADVTIDITMEDGVIAMVHQCVTQKPQ